VKLVPFDRANLHLLLICSCGVVFWLLYCICIVVVFFVCLGVFCFFGMGVVVFLGFVGLVLFWVGDGRSEICRTLPIIRNCV
jgi:hypothetical protein